jgi:hypothetical protein
MADTWKEHLLKSGLPFEHEVKECFVKHGCTVWDEFTYLKDDENKIEKEFSYDLDANTWKDGCSVDFMIECKYKTEPTKWIFSPDPYSYQNDTSINAFLHPIDHFTKHDFLFKHSPFDQVLPPLGPFCLKGVEILKDKPLEVNITRAITQLSYAFADRAISSFNEQLNNEMFANSIFLQIPIIITNADLYVMRNDITTKDISKAKAIEEVASSHQFLFFHNKIGEHLRDHNFSKVQSYFASQQTDKLNERLSTFTKDFDHFTNVICSNYMPEVIVIMRHDPDNHNYKVLFDYLNFLLTNTEERKRKIVEVSDEAEMRHKEFKENVAKKKAEREAKQTSDYKANS